MVLGQPGHKERAAVSTYMVGGVQAADADSSLVSQPRPKLFRFWLARNLVYNLCGRVYEVEAVYPLSPPSLTSAPIHSLHFLDYPSAHGSSKNWKNSET